MLKIGIVGLPNVGKSTLFKALTKKQVDIADYPFTTIDPNVGVVGVPDHNLKKLEALVHPEKTLPAVIEVVDIAGLIKGAHKGEGLGNQFLSHIYGVDAILFLIETFRDKDNPQEHMETLREELIKKDEDIEKRHAKNKDELPPHLSRKPSLIVCNGKESASRQDMCDLVIDAKLELEMSEMDEKEAQGLGVVSRLPTLIQHLFITLNLITFYTIKGGKELRAWPVPRGTKAPNAAGIVHTDFKEKFIRAEVIRAGTLLGAGGWKEAREKGLLRTEGKEYIVQNADVIEFRI